MSTGAYFDSKTASYDQRTRADYDDLKEMKEGQAIVAYATEVMQVSVFYSNPGFAKAMRVTRFVALPPPDETIIKHSDQITKLRDRLVHKTWTAKKADVAVETPPDIKHLREGIRQAEKVMSDPVDQGICALGALHSRLHPDDTAQASAAPPSAESRAASPPPAAPPSSPPEGAAASNPMGFFGRQDPAAQPVADPAHNQAVTDTPPQSRVKTENSVKWDHLVEMAGQTEDPSNQGAGSDLAAAPAKHTADVLQRLNRDVAKILEDAGANLRRSIFKDDAQD